MDPGSSAFLTPGSGSGMEKNTDSGSGLNIPNQFSESLETFSGLKIQKFFDAAPGSLIPVSGIAKFGSGINIPDLQHVYLIVVSGG